MKHLFTQTLLLLLLALAGCNNADDTTIDESASQQLTFSVLFPDDDTRLEFKDSDSPILYWGENDQIKVYSFEGTKNPSEETYQISQNCELQSGAGTAEATFNGLALDSWTLATSSHYGSTDKSQYGLRFRAIYTKTLSNLGQDEENPYKVKFEMPYVQSGEKDLSCQVCYTPNATGFLSYDNTATNAESVKLKFQLTPATALFRLRLKLDDSCSDDSKEFSRLTLTSGDDTKEALMGENTINLLDGTVSYREVDCSTSVKFDDITITKEGYTDFYLSTWGTSSSTTITLSCSRPRNAEFYKSDGITDGTTFTIPEGIKSGYLYTVKRVIKYIE